MADIPKSQPLQASWMEHLGAEFGKPYMLQLRDFLRAEKKIFRVYPRGSDIFNAFWFAAYADIRVVILGQDPYHGQGQAHGLCFSVPQGVPQPPSLVNILKELHDDAGVPIPGHGCLEHWARQGVFLLNTTLSVREKSPQSHVGQGWEIFTDKVIEVLNAGRENLVFMLWGRPAQAKMGLIDKSRHLILQAPHPSPLSAHRGFFGCRHFSQANRYLEQHGHAAIHWDLTKANCQTGAGQIMQSDSPGFS